MHHEREHEHDHERRCDHDCDHVCDCDRGRFNLLKITTKGQCIFKKCRHRDTDRERDIERIREFKRLKEACYEYKFRNGFDGAYKYKYHKKDCCDCNKKDYCDPCEELERFCKGCCH
jgi:hypothetical protein